MLSMMPRATACVRWLVVLATLGSAAGCGDYTPQFPPPCPAPRLLPDTEDLLRYRPAPPGQPGRDVTDLVFSGRIFGVRGTCEAGDKNTLKAKMNVSIEATRGPAASGRTADFAYFVAAVKGDTVLDRQIYPVHIEFPPNTDKMTITSPDVNMVFPTPKGTSGIAYSIVTGFWLTPEELAANRRRSAP